MLLYGNARRPGVFVLFVAAALLVLVPALAVPSARSLAAKRLDALRSSLPGLKGVDQHSSSKASAQLQTRARPAGLRTLSRLEVPAVPGTATADNIHPAWSAGVNGGSDAVYFSSTRPADVPKVALEDDDGDGVLAELPPGGQPPRWTYSADAGPEYTVYQGLLDPVSGRISGAVQVTTRVGNQLYPVANADRSMVAYCATQVPVIPPPPEDTGGGDGGTTTQQAQQQPAPPPEVKPNPLPLQLEVLVYPPPDSTDPPTVVAVPIDPAAIAAIKASHNLPASAKVVVSAHKPSFSPDGRFIIFGGLAGTVAPAPAAQQGEPPAEPAVLPEQTVFTPIEWDLYVCRATPTPGMAYKMVYTSSKEPDLGFSSADPNLAKANMADEFEPVFSPDGESVAFVRGKLSVQQVPFASDRKGFQESWTNGHIWVAPIRSPSSPIPTPGLPTPSSPIPMVLGQPRRMTFFSGVRPPATTLRESIEFQPAWTSTGSLGFVSNRGDLNGDTIADSLSSSMSIWSLPSALDPEADGVPATSYASGRNLARKETFQVPLPESFDEVYPSFLSSSPMPGEVTKQIVYQSTISAVTGGGKTPYPTDIWVTQVDGKPSGIFRLGALPTVTPRLQTPGEPVTIRVPIISSSTQVKPALVQAIIRYPDRKLFGVPGLGTQITDQNQNPNTDDPNASVPSVVPSRRPNVYRTGTVDGGIPINVVGEVGCEAVDMLRLFDDGPTGGHGDVLAGDGVYSNVWTTPLTPRDYYLDVTVTGDVMLGDLGSGGLAFDYLDNVWGFSTLPFVKQNPVLLVSDYTAGQSWQYSVTSADPKRNVLSLPVESYYTSRPAPRITAEVNPTERKPIATWAQDGFDVLGPKTPFYNLEPETADIWRTQCRDPIPLEVLMQYAPQSVQQVNESGGTTTVKAAYASVVWASPYAGNLTVGPGTITDPLAQQTLMRFLNAGGRLLLSGQDVGWALTQHNTIPNPLLSDYFRVTLADDASSDADNPFLGGPPQQYRRQLSAVRQTNAIDDILIDGPVSTNLHWGARAPTDLWISPAQGFIAVPPYDVSNQQLDGAWNQQWLDGLETVTTTTDPNDGGTGNGGTTTTPGPLNQAFQFRYTDPGVVFDTAAIREAAAYYHDPGRDFKTAYLAFGLEGLHRSYAALGNTVFCNNRAAQIMHNALCWMQQFRMSGSVYDSYLGKPIPNAIVRLRSTLRLTQTTTTTDANGNTVTTVNNPVVKATRTDANGRFVFEGVDADSYQLEAEKPGFLFHHSEAFSVHGLYDITMPTLVLTRQPPGQVVGTVTDATTGVALENARVVISKQSPDEPLTMVAETDAQGNYFIRQAEVGQYTIIAVAAGHQPASSTSLQVNSGQTTTLNLSLGTGVAGPGGTGTLAGFVRSASGAVVAGASVRLLKGTAEVAGSQVVTGTDGVFGLMVPPGQYTLEASAGGLVGTRLVNVPQPPDVAVADVILQSSTPPPSGGNTIPAGVSFVSLPGEYAGTDAATLLGNQPDMKMATYANGAYVLYPNAPAESFHAGRGYWVKLSAPVSVTTSGAAPPVNAQGYFERPLDTTGGGWNTIGNPFSSTVPLTALRVSSGGNVMTLQEAVTAGLVKPTLWAYQGGRYLQTDRLQPGVGYWIRANSAVTLLIPGPQPTGASLRARARTQSPPAFSALQRARQMLLEMRDRAWGPPPPPFN